MNNNYLKSLLLAAIFSVTFAHTAFADKLFERKGAVLFVRGDNRKPRSANPINLAALKTENLKGNDIGQNIVTLYRYDPIANSLKLTSNKYGLCFDNPNGVIVNCGTDLEINFQQDFATNKTIAIFRAGPEGNNKGTVIDLGTSDEINARYASKVPEGFNMGLGDWYGTLHTSDTTQAAFTFVNGNQETLIPLTESADIFSAQEKNYIEAKTGHIYVMRIFNPQGLELIAKLLVLSSDDDKVTIRYGVIRDTPEAQ